MKTKVSKVEVHLYTQSEPVVMDRVRNAYQKGDLYCVMMSESAVVYKFPLHHIFRITETDIPEDPNQ